MENYTAQQIEEFKIKAEKWDRLASEIEKVYCNAEGEYDDDNPEIQGDLETIGEMAATAFGWL